MSTESCSPRPAHSRRPGREQAVSECVSIVQDEDSLQVGLDAKGVGFDVLLLAALGFGFRQLHEFAEADRAARRASSLLEELAAKWMSRPWKSVTPRPFSMSLLRLVSHPACRTFW